MKRSVIALLALAAAADAAVMASADEPLRHRFELPNRDTLELTIPVGWTQSLQQPEGGGPPTIEIAVSGDGPPQVFVTPEWPDPLAKEIRELPTLRDAVRDLAERIQPQSAESRIEVRPVGGTDGGGYYFTATERHPGPGDFKFMSQGALQLAGLTLWFTILTREGEDTVAVQALAMLQSAAHHRTGLDQL